MNILEQTISELRGINERLDRICTNLEKLTRIYDSLERTEPQTTSARAVPHQFQTGDRITTSGLPCIPDGEYVVRRTLPEYIKARG